MTGLDLAHPDHLVPDSRGVGPDGDLFLTFPVESPAVRAASLARNDELPAVLELSDVAPVAVPHRIRGRARVSGWLSCVPGLAGPGRMALRLEFGEAYVDDLWGAEEVGAEAFRDARPDPLAAHETELLQHLHAAHGEQLRTLCALLGERSAVAGGPGGPDVVPVALDRFGLRARFLEGRGACFDARFDFPEPVRDTGELQRAMYRLFEAAAH